MRVPKAPKHLTPDGISGWFSVFNRMKQAQAILRKKGGWSASKDDLLDLVWGTFLVPLGFTADKHEPKRLKRTLDGIVAALQFIQEKNREEEKAS